MGKEERTGGARGKEETEKEMGVEKENEGIKKEASEKKNLTG